MRRCFHYISSHRPPAYLVGRQSKFSVDRIRRAGSLVRGSSSRACVADAAACRVCAPSVRWRRLLLARGGRRCLSAEAGARPGELVLHAHPNGVSGVPRSWHTQESSDVRVRSARSQLASAMGGHGRNYRSNSNNSSNNRGGGGYGQQRANSGGQQRQL